VIAKLIQSNSESFLKSVCGVRQRAPITNLVWRALALATSAAVDKLLPPPVHLIHVL